MAPEQSAPDGSIVITPKEFYDGVRSDVSEIKGSIGQLRESLAPVPERLVALEQTAKEHDGRLDALERKAVWLAGLAAGAGGVIGAVAPRFFGA